MLTINNTYKNINKLLKQKLLSLFSVIQSCGRKCTKYRSELQWPTEAIPSLPR